MDSFVWAAAAVESYVAFALLLIASLVMWRRLVSAYFLAGAIGFAVGLLGAIYRAFVVSNTHLFCTGSAAQMPEYISCANLHVAYGSAFAASGLIVAGMAFLLYAIKHPRRQPSAI